MKIISYRELRRIIAPPELIPGKRIYFPVETFFAHWINQHQQRINNIVFSFEGGNFLDTALMAWENFPEIIEDGNG